MGGLQRGPVAQRARCDWVFMMESVLITLKVIIASYREPRGRKCSIHGFQSFSKCRHFIKKDCFSFGMDHCLCYSLTDRVHS